MKFLKLLITLLLVLSCSSKPKEPKEIYMLVQVKGRGVFGIKLYKDKSPINVKNITKLAKKGFYNGLTFHLVTDNIVQGGDPRGDGTGTAGYIVADDKEGKKLHHKRGTVSMANFGKPNTNSCQFFICKKDMPQLDGKYTVIGEVDYGMEIVDKIKKGDTILTISVEERY